jgi:hypothetical protein
VADLLIDGRFPVEPGRYDRVDVVVRDRAALRALPLPGGVRASTVAVRLREGVAALSLVARPEWPALQSIESRRDDEGWLTVLVFGSRVPVHAVVGELGRQSVWPDRVGQRGLVVHRPGHHERDKVPADVLVADWHMTWDEDGEPPVTGRHPYVVTDPQGPLALGPLDERVLNPTGFGVAPTEARGRLSTLTGIADGPTAELVRGLRPLSGVEVDLEEEADVATARLVAGLAMAGIPLTADRVPPGYVALLGSDVCAAITTVVDLEDPMAREEHSVVLRRAALTEFSSYAWRRRLGGLTGVRVHHQASVSVVMATRRPHLVGHAVTGLARQRGVESLELVLAPHGFAVDEAELREALGDAVSLNVVRTAQDARFGDVLQAAAEVASGDVVLKLDDDDWYSPDFVADLLHARSYSGAELVGAPDDLYYLEDLGRTLRLGQPTEVYRQFVAGGTMLLDRTLLREVGGFRSVTRHVDAQLIAAVRDAGGATYRMHGLGYVMRRSASGHTWDADLDDLVDRAVQGWDGFRPGRLMEL